MTGEYKGIQEGYKIADQENLPWSQSFRTSVRTPAIANRIFDTLAHAQAYVDAYTEMTPGYVATAVPGITLSVINDDVDSKNNGLWRVVKVKESAIDTDGVLEKVCSLEVLGIPTELHKLIYSEPDENGEMKLIAKGFMYDGEAGTEKLYVVSGDTEFNECTKSEPVVPDIINDWIQYADSTSAYSYMSEFGKGTKPINSGYGYSHWSGQKDNINKSYRISNPINSTELNGYINPSDSSYISSESILGTVSGNTSGDQIGVSLINTDGVTPRHVVDDKGVSYYRNTLYDTSSKCAWVSEDGTTAKVVYAAKNTSGNETKPSGNIFSVDDNTTHTGRLTTTDTGIAVSIPGNIVEANGTLYILCVMTENAEQLGSTSCGVWQGNGTAPGKFTTVPGKNTLYVYGLITKIVNGVGQALSLTPLVSCDPASPAYIGNQLIPFDTNRNGMTNGNWSFIKNKFLFEDGLLTVQFSDVKYDSGITEYNSIVEYGDALLDGSTLPNNGYNGSKLVINFRTGKYSLFAKGGTPISAFTDKDMGDGYTQEFLDAFSSKAHFMYHAMSFQNLYIKTKGVETFKDRIIIRKDGDLVYRFDRDAGHYVIVQGVKPTEYFYGSHMAYNEITNKLWYSNGQEIYPITAGIKQDDIKHEYHPDSSLLTSTTIALGGVASGTLGSALDGKTVSEMFDLLLFPTYIAKLSTGSAPSLLDGNNKASGTFEVGSTPPTLTFNIGGTPTATAGTHSVACTPVEGSEQITISQADMNSVHDITKSRSVTYSNSTAKIPDTKGSDCPYVHPSQSNFLRTDAETAEGQTLSTITQYVTTDGKLKYDSRSGSYTAHVVYPYYAKINSNDGGTDIDTAGTQANPTTDLTKYSKQTITNDSQFEFTTTFVEVDGDRVSFLLPASFTGVKLLPFNAVAGQYPADADAATVANNQLVASSSFYMKTAIGYIAQYKKYTYDATKANPNKYKVKFTKA